MQDKAILIDRRRVLLVAFGCALVALILVPYLKDYPAMVAVPICLGTVFLIAVEIRMQMQNPQGRQLLLKSESEHRGLHHYRGHVIIFRELWETTEGQNVFDFAKLERRKRVDAQIRKVKNGEIFEIDSEAFVAALQKKLEITHGQVAEAMIKTALHRYGEMKSLSAELEQFLTEESTLSVLKSGMKANAAHAVQKCAESVIQELIKKLKKTPIHYPE